VNSATCSFLAGVANAIYIYTIIMIVYAVVSWVPSLRGRWSDYIAMVVEPVVAPVRRIIPPVGGLDLSFLVVLILLQVLRAHVIPTACYYL